MTAPKDILKKFFPAIPVAFVLGSMIFSHSCANTTQAPSGGDKDTIPPVVVSTEPAMMSAGVPVHGTTITLTFNEYVTVKNAQNILLSPPQAKPVKNRIKGKSVVLSFEDDLDSNTTYSLNLIDAIADNNEGNMMPPFTFVFSTGKQIDSMMVTGQVQDCNTLSPLKDICVMLYKDLADSAVLLDRPFAVTKTDDWGFFCIRNIPDTSYRIYAVKDDNNNRIYNPDENELIAFVDSVIKPLTVVNDSLPELQSYDMKDTTACLARKTEYEMRLFREKPSRQMIMKKVRVSDRSSYITFNAPNAHIDSMWLRGIAPDRLITQFNIQRDSLEIWVNDRKKQGDTLHLFVNYRKTDTLGRLIPELEHVKLFYQAEEGSSSKTTVTASKSSRRDIKHEDTICVYKLEAKAETVEQLGFELEFTYPIVTEGFDSLRLKSINPKQQESAAAFDVIKDTNNIRKFRIMPKDKMLVGYDYVLKMPHRLFRDINGYYNDSTEVKVSLPNDESLSTLNVILSGVHNKYIIDLLNEQRSETLRSFVVDTDRTLAFPYLKAGKYCIRITEDVNRNSIVDSGSLLDHRQPEQVLFYKVNDNMLIEVPEKAEIDQEINIEEVFK